MGLLGRDKCHIKMIGEISEAAITTRFLQLGYIVLMPYGGSQRYDLVMKTLRVNSGGCNAKLVTSMKVGQ